MEVTGADYSGKYLRSLFRPDDEVSCKWRACCVATPPEAPEDTSCEMLSVHTDCCWRFIVSTVALLVPAYAGETNYGGGCVFGQCLIKALPF